MVRLQEITGKQRVRDQRRGALEARINALRKEFEAEDEEAREIIRQDELRQKSSQLDRQRMAANRGAPLESDAIPSPTIRKVRR